MYGRAFFIGILITLSGLPSFAGLLEILSKGASVATLNTCSSYDKEKSQKEIIQAANNSICDNFGSGTPTFKQQFTELKSFLRGDQEDQYFALLADQQVKELRCAGSYASQIANAKDEDPIITETVAKLQLARTAKHNLSRATQKLATSPNVSTRVCPMDYDSLVKEFPVEERNSETYQLCNEIIVNRQGYNALVSSIGLSGTTSVGKLIDKYANESVQVPLKESDSALIKRIKAAYVGAEKDLNKSANIMNKTLQEKGGAGFERQDRYALLQDPALSKTVLDRNGAEDLRGVACQADARYGSGADKLDKFVLTGSVLLSGGAAIAIRTGAAATRAAVAANAARSAGLTSFNGMRMLQYSALAADFYVAADYTDRACSKHAISEFKTQSACVSAPSLEKNKQDNCILMATLSATGFAAMVPKELLRKLGGAIVGTETKMPTTATEKLFKIEKAPDNLVSTSPGIKPQPESPVVSAVTQPTLSPAAQAGLAKAKELNAKKLTLSDRLQAARATGDKAKIKAMEDEIAKSLSDGEIVHSEKVGFGIADAEFVTYADGAQGVWKADDFILRTADAETVFHDVNKHLDTGLNPYTTKKTLNGVEGSVQLRITSLKNGPTPRYPDELGFVDYLLSNPDRHGLNYLRETDGKLHAIDHGLAGADVSFLSPSNIGFTQFKDNVYKLKDTIEKRQMLQSKPANAANNTEIQNLRREESIIQSEINMFVPKKEVVEKLRQTSKSDWEKIIGDRFRPEQIAQIMEHQKELLTSIDKAEKEIGKARLYPGGDFSPLMNKDAIWKKQNELRNKPSQ